MMINIVFLVAFVSVFFYLITFFRFTRRFPHQRDCFPLAGCQD